MSRDSKNWTWGTLDHNGQNAHSVEHAILAVLMDIRDELQEIKADQIITDNVLRSRLNCHETLSMPRLLRRIAANTAKPKKRKKKTA